MAWLGRLKPSDDQPDYAHYAESPEGGGAGYSAFYGT